MTNPLPTALPYGIRDLKVTPYTDAQGSVLDETAGASVDFPYARTLSFSETEDFEELRGDDRTITMRGKGPIVEFEFESGGIPLKGWKVVTGGEILEEGVTPARKVRLLKRGSHARPWFRVEGQAISDSGGDVHCTLYRCRITDELEGEMNEGEFFLSSGSGTALPLLGDVDDYLYEFVQNETAVAIPTTPVANPTTP
jgi:hypothetical protein